jgi:hypothetical protein
LIIAALFHYAADAAIDAAFSAIAISIDYCHAIIFTLPCYAIYFSFSTCHYFRHYFAFRHSFSPLFRHFAYFDYFHYFIIAIISLSLFSPFFISLHLLPFSRHLRHYFH